MVGRYLAVFNDLFSSAWPLLDGVMQRGCEDVNKGDTGALSDLVGPITPPTDVLSAA